MFFSLQISIEAIQIRRLTDTKKGSPVNMSNSLTSFVHRHQEVFGEYYADLAQDLIDQQLFSSRLLPSLGARGVGW